MTVEELNKKAERLVELYEDRKKEKACRTRIFREIFGEYLLEDYYDRLLAGSEYVQDKEINELTTEIDNGLQELGLSEIFTRSLNIERYCDVFCVEYVPFDGSKSDYWFVEES